MNKINRSILPTEYQFSDNNANKKGIVDNLENFSIDRPILIIVETILM